ncbi:hypothetical protein WA158_001409 [Blastocystis sp. Blastoise]
MKSFLYTILIGTLFLSVQVFAQKSFYGSIDLIDGEYIYKEGEDKNSLAWGRMDNAIHQTGWNFLSINTNEKNSNEDQAYAAGLLEGILTHNQIYTHIKNQKTEEKPQEKVRRYFEENAKWDEEQKKSGKDRLYWHHKEMMDRQAQGVIDGYFRAASEEQNFVTAWQIKVLTYEYDIWDLNIVLPDVNTTSATTHNLRTSIEEYRRKMDHCSALLRITPNYEDIYISHITWAGAESMYRFYKVYDMPLHVDPQTNDVIVPGHKISMSSYPGRFTSGDDFYEISSGLIVQETTDAIWDESLNKNIQPHTVYQWARNALANRLANNAKEWTDIFGKYQSGTYNNQWMVYDLKKFHPYEGIEDGSFYIYESIPGEYRVEDETQHLRDTQYWASYNIPAIPYIYNISGYPDKVKEMGILYDYTETPRAQIFKRDVHKVIDLSSMQYMMRYNDFQHDPLSRCDCNPPYTSQYTISSRSDLNDINGTYPFPALAFRNHMGTDAKLTSYKMFHDSFASAFISGPTYQNQPAFQFSSSPLKDLPHEDMPDKWEFPWFYIQKDQLTGDLKYQPMNN